MGVSRLRPINLRRALNAPFFAIGLAAVVACSGGDGQAVECGSGTELRDDVCVAVAAPSTTAATTTTTSAPAATTTTAPSSGNDRKLDDMEWGILVRSSFIPEAMLDNPTGGDPRPIVESFGNAICDFADEVDTPGQFQAGLDVMANELDDETMEAVGGSGQFSFMLIGAITFMCTDSVDGLLL